MELQNDCIFKLHTDDPVPAHSDLPRVPNVKALAELSFNGTCMDTTPDDKDAFTPDLRLVFNTGRTNVDLVATEGATSYHVNVETEIGFQHVMSRDSTGKAQYHFAGAHYGDKALPQTGIQRLQFVSDFSQDVRTKPAIMGVYRHQLKDFDQSCVFMLDIEDAALSNYAALMNISSV